jgi:hypothetical protein
MRADHRFHTTATSAGSIRIGNWLSASVPRSPIRSTAKSDSVDRQEPAHSAAALCLILAGGSS